MTGKSITYYFSLMSPWAYLGHDHFVDLAKRHGLTINFAPVFLGEVFAATGGLPLAQRPQSRQNYRILELQRWREKRGLPLNIRPKFWPFDVRLVDQTVIAIVQAGQDPAAFIGTAFAACWAGNKNLAEPEVLAPLLESVGLPAKLVQQAGSDVVAAQYAANSASAIDQGAFGSPAYVWQGEVFWGQDRLDLLEDALKSGRAPYKII